MQLHTLHASNTRRPKKRVGRGGKRGTTAGRGTKGQRSRAGHRIRPASRDIVLKFPKLRGVGNTRRSVPAVAVRTEAIVRVLAKAKATTLTREALVAARVIKSVKDPVKVVLGKSPETPLAVSGVPCSKGAREAILKAGGSVS